MSMRENSTEKAQPVDLQQLRTRLGFLSKVVVLLVLVCVLTNGALNVYFVLLNSELKLQNSALKSSLDRYEQKRQAYVQFHGFVRQLTAELLALGKTDESVQDLLSKYRRALITYGLDTEVIPQNSAAPRQPSNK